jgi:hypothetical protein
VTKPPVVPTLVVFNTAFETGPARPHGVAIE